MPAQRVTISMHQGKNKGNAQSQLMETGPLLVLNKDSKTVATDFDNPYELEYSTAAAEANLVILPNSRGARYLELFHLHTGTSAPSTNPTVYAYGAIPFDRASTPEALKPSDVSSANFDNHPRVWLPLEDADTPGNFALAFSGQAIIQDVTAIGTPATAVRIGDNSTAAAAVKSFSISKPKRVILSGCDEVMVAVQTAAAGPTAGLIVGRLIW